MCGRFTIGEVKGLLPRFSIESPVADMPAPRYNLAPSQDAPVIINHSPNRLVMMRWGLIPFWAKDESMGPRLINARAESIAERPAFRGPFKKGRCLVPATGFYEWRSTPVGRIPYHFRLRGGELFAFAGLCDRWTAPDGREVRSFSIVTTGPNELMAPIHDRMPLILRREDEERWVRPGDITPEELRRMAEPYPSADMVAYEVSRAVSDPTNDSPELIRPVGGQRQRTLF